VQDRRVKGLVALRQRRHHAAHATLCRDNPHAVADLQRSLQPACST
jgi:hypothetical protein